MTKVAAVRDVCTSIDCSYLAGPTRSGVVGKKMVGAA